MKSSFKIFLFLLLPFFAKAQSLQSEIDSLKHGLIVTKNDTLRMKTYFRIAGRYDDVNLDSAVYYGEKAINIANLLQLKFDEETMKVNLSWVLGKIGNYPLAFKRLNIAQDFFSNSSNEKYINTVPTGQSTESIRLNWLFNAYSALGGLYNYAGIHEKAVLLYSQALQIALQIKDDDALSEAYSGICEAHFNLNKIDSALYYCQKSIVLAEKDSFKKYIANVYIQMGEILHRKGDFGIAKQYFKKAIEAGTLYKNTVQIGEAHIRLASLYQSQNNIDSSLYQAKEALAILKLSAKEKSTATAYRMVSDYYGMLGQADSCFAYLKAATVLTDKLEKAEKEKIKELQVAGFEETQKFQELEKGKILTQNKIRTYGLLGGIGILSVIGFILYRNNKKEKKAKAVIEKTLTELKSTQTQLIQSEKMASLGELTAGIAHEIQNPLNFVNNFSEVSNELIDEMKTEFKKGDTEEGFAIANDIKQNLEKILHHGKRADAIVKGMLQHSSSGSGKKEPTDINKLADEYLRLAYHGLRAKDKSFNATMKTDFDVSIGNIKIIPQDIGRVILNLITNAFYACTERSRSVMDENKKKQPAGYEPTVSVSTKKVNGTVEIKVADNGNGIPQKVMDKIFQPFFTTKPTGQGTGLGLSLSYDIVKAHGGELKVETKEGEGSEFIIVLPV
jgi:signal transduction histidine kinase